MLRTSIISIKKVVIVEKFVPLSVGVYWRGKKVRNRLK